MEDSPYFSPYFRRGGYLPEPPPRGDWTCVYCGSLHPGAAYSCNRCGAPRQAKRPEPPAYVSATQAAIWAHPPRKPTAKDKLGYAARRIKYDLRNYYWRLRRLIGWPVYLDDDDDYEDY